MIKQEMNNKYGRLTVQNFYKMNRHGAALWFANCQCGTKNHIVNGNNLRTGNVTSCGCLRRERAKSSNITHNLRYHPLYSIWWAMLQRCYYIKQKDYHNYGGRGIKVCDWWRHSVKHFIEDMGPRPKGFSLDRINNNGNYRPRNCRWTTAAQQALNRRKVRL